MWASFIRLMRIVDQDFPEATSTMPLPVDGHTRRSTREWMRSKALGPIGSTVVLPAWAPVSGHYKRWPAERFVALAERLRSAKRRIF